MVGVPYFSSCNGFQMKLAYFIRDDFFFLAASIAKSIRKAISFCILNHGSNLSFYSWNLTDHLVDYV